MTKKFAEVLGIIAFSFASALNYTVFVFPNKFAPSGIDGICTMIQDVFDVSMGYFSLLVNIPLIIIAFFVLNREFVLKSAVYVISFSLSVILLKHINLTGIMYISDTGAGIALAPVAAGTIRGILYAVTLKLNGSSAGIDIISAIVKKHKPHLKLMNIIFGFNVIIALCSYFVYGLKAEPVICSIIYSFITSKVSNHIRSSEKEKIKFEIITDKAELLCRKVLDELEVTATIVNAKGAYSGNGTQMVICVVKKEQAPFIEKLADGCGHCVIFRSTLNNLSVV
ncbi:MAG: YitT family protein [Clostridia bacterium]|nr:YitT family protein [Clostridia bacterium]